MKHLSRRAALKLAGTGVVGGLTANAAGGNGAGGEGVAVAALQTEFAYEALVSIAPAVEVGRSSHGIRRYIPITGGTFQGAKITGTVLPGGADWQLERPDGVTEIDALYSMKTEDGAVIVVRNRGLIAAGGKYLRTVPQFEAPLGVHDWLNKSIFVGSVSGAPQPGAVTIRVFRVL